MDLVEDLTDFGAPEYVVNGPAVVEWISPHQVRITYFVRRKVGNKVANVASHHSVWDIHDLLASQDAYAVVFAQLRAEAMGMPLLKWKKAN